MPRSKSARKREWHGETHASRGSSEFRIWMQMIGRCTTPTHRRFADYGGRGIQVCERWLESVTNFIADMGRRPSADHQLERKDNDGPYAPHNCVWATRTEQGRNKRNNVLMTLAGRTQPMSAWAEELKLPYSTLRRRKARLGWSDEEALMTPVGGATSERRRAANPAGSAGHKRRPSLEASHGRDPPVPQGTDRFPRVLIHRPPRRFGDGLLRRSASSCLRPVRSAENDMR